MTFVGEFTLIVNKHFTPKVDKPQNVVTSYQSITLDPDTVKRYSLLHFVAQGGYLGRVLPIFQNLFYI